MQRQSGNFLLQALLALALIVAFMPFFSDKLATREKNAQMHATASQIETATTAARIYLREKIGTLQYNTTTLSGDGFSDTLEPYGLPLGFIPKTVFNQNIKLVINKTTIETNAFLEISAGDISEMKRAELARRIGFYATNGPESIIVKVSFDEVFSDIVRRNESNPDDNGFLSDLDLGGFGLENAGVIFARNGQFKSYQTNNLSVFGIEDGRKIRNKIDELDTPKVVFQSTVGESALSITRGVLTANEVYGKTISKFGDTGSLTTASASIYDFFMTAGRTSFTGPANWDVKGNMISDRVSFTVERLEISSSINASRGQDVFINPESLEYNAKSGIETRIMRAGNITMRDQTSDALMRGETGAIILDIRPAGTSALPDVLLEEINNDAISIIAKPEASDGKTVDCKSIILSLGGAYNRSSLSQNIICQYVFWQRLEKRINIKQCIIEERSGC